MGLEVAYKAFVGDDSGFLESIHPISDIGVDVANSVSDGEEGVFNDQFVLDVFEMDLHVLDIVPSARCNLIPPVTLKRHAYTAT